ncbi:MAG: DinB family protein [Chitinophagaceae bacterium]
MQKTLSKEEIIRQLLAASQEFSAECAGISDEIFFRQPATKWSVAQNVTHLVTSANMTRLAYRLPKFIVRLYAGKPNRPSRSFDELANKYKLKLEQGGKASGRFVAKPVAGEQGKENVITGFSKSMNRLTRSIEKNWDDSQLDRYLAPHPLLGKLTLRELAYFTIYHTQHHLHIIRERVMD